MSLLLSNNLLRAAEANVERRLLPKNHSDYLRIVVAGMKIGLDKGPDSILASLAKSKDPINDAAVGAINLCLLMRKQSRGTMPVQAMVPAAMSLMLHALDFADKAGIVKVGEPELIRASRIFINHIFKQFNITGQMLQTVSAKIRGVMSNPANVEKMKQSVGLTKHPDAAPVPPAGGANAV